MDWDLWGLTMVTEAEAPTGLPIDEQIWRARWRLILGPGAEGVFGALPDGEWGEQDAALGFLYDREYATGRNVRPGGARSGGLGPSQMTVPEWINKVHVLFPRRTVERLEKDALERYQLEEMVTNPALLARARPSKTLLRAILHTKHLMNQEVLSAARALVRRVVEELMGELAREVHSPFSGALDRSRRSSVRVARNFDAQATIRRNLRHFDPRSQRLVIQEPCFNSRVRRFADRWQVIVLVDQSGSMIDSVIHAAIMASIFHGIRSIRSHLCVFDTEVVDLSGACSDPVETLMRVQLGGGTDIGHALDYAASLVTNPVHTIIALISDLYEGAPETRLLSLAHQLVESGVSMLGLAALDMEAEPVYDRQLAGKLATLGVHVGAMTPGELAAWVAERVRR
jgi:Mg-chelatase subunit ChlD